MPARIGIELAPSACRIVELDAPLRHARHAASPRVRSFSVFSRSDRALIEAFGALRRRHARVVVWDVPGGHRQVIVAHGPYQRMRVEARGALRRVGVPVGTLLSDIAPGASPPQNARRRAVLVATADAAGIDAALAPLVNAGIRIDAVLTPAAALLSLALLRRSSDRSDAAPGDEAFVVLEESVGCVALLRGGAMIGARTLPWGYVDDTSGRQLLRSRQEVATRIAGDLTEFMSAARCDPRGLGQISICGAMPDLRSMAAHLVERLDIEVEPIDTLFGNEPSGPGANHFGDRVAEMRLAWTAAADARPLINLLRIRRGRSARTYRSRAAIAAGVAVGLAVGWFVQDRLGPVAARPDDADRREPGFAPERPAPPPVAVAQAPISPAAAAPPPLTEPSPPAPPPEGQAGRAGQAESLTTAPVAPLPPDASRAPVPSTPTRAPRPPEMPLPFDASLETILFGLERRLAIVDGRIVGEGDEVRGARIVEITQNAVLLRDAQGRLRRLTGGSR